MSGIVEQKVRVTADTLYAWIRSRAEVTGNFDARSTEIHMRLSYINYLEAGKRRSSISGFSFYLEHSYFALFCFVHSQIAQDGSIWRGLYFAENPIFFFGFNFVVIFFRNLTLFDFLSQTSTILLHTQVTAVMNNHVETLKTVWILFRCRHILSKYWSWPANYLVM